VNRQIKSILFLLLFAALLLSACASPTSPAPATQESPGGQASVPTQAQPTQAEPTQPPEPSPTSAGPHEGRLILATTTSTRDSGLLDYLLPDFENQSGANVDVIAVGTGQAMTLGQDGNADVLLVHARDREDAFMAAGDGVRREDVMYNDFVIVGPASDPAGIKGMTDAAAAFTKIADTQSPFVSRGDDSGTNIKEMSIWNAAGIEPAGDWYIAAGQGMGAVLTMSDEQQAYTLSDRATYLARTLEGLDLEIEVEGDPILFNPYGVIAVNPDKNPYIQADLANEFIDWLVSLPTQEEISQFGVAEFGQALFVPDSQAWRDAHSSSTSGDSPALANAALKITGAVAQETGWTEEEVRAMDTLEVESTNSQGQSDTYTGVLISSLLAEAQPSAEATTVVFVGDDGSTSEQPLADIQACENCIISFRTKGGFSVVLPGMPNPMPIKGVVEIQVK
jgi:tungstate transport system substrate-binding protein